MPAVYAEPPGPGAPDRHPVLDAMVCGVLKAFSAVIHAAMDARAAYATDTPSERPLYFIN